MHHGQAVIDRWARAQVKPRCGHLVSVGASDRDYRVRARDQWILICLLQGQVAYHDASQVLHLQQHDCLLIPPGRPWRWLSERGCKQAHFEFRFDWYETDDPLQLTDVLPMPLQVGSSEACQAAEVALQRYARWQPRSGDGQLFLRCELDRVLSACLHAALAQMRSAHREWHLATRQNADALPELLQEFSRDLFHNGRRAGWRISTLARGLGVSPAHLTRLCRQHLQQSPQQVLRRERVRVAVELLRSGAVTRVAEAAERVGYDRTQLFRYCRDELGVSPQELLLRPQSI